MAKFQFNFTQDELNQLIHTSINDQWFAALSTELQAANIVTAREVAAFIAQTGHESAGYTTLVENLNYSEQALLSLFPSHFSGAADAANYARQPEKIANRIYSNRMGNGNEASGDGWKFRGRGLIQLTGRDNYTQFGSVNNPDYLSTPAGAVASAAWFWNKNNLNQYADAGEITIMTKIINGGTNGLNDRIARYNAACKVFGI